MSDGDRSDVSRGPGGDSGRPAEPRVDESVERIEARSQESRRAFRQSLIGLGGVLQPMHGAREGLSLDPFVAACQLVAEATGIELPAEESLEGPTDVSADPVFELARRGSFFARRVALSGDWWTKDHGPLLGKSSEGETYYALLWRRRGYDVVDPESGERRRVNAGVAEELAPEAHVFYAPLPEGQLKPRSLLRFALRGSGGGAFLILAMILLTGLLSLATPVFTGWIMEPVIPEAQKDQLLILTLGLILAGVAMQVFSLVQALAMLRLEGRMTNAVQAAVWDRLLKLPSSFFRRFLVGDLANRAMSIDTLRQQLSSSAVGAMMHSVVGLFSLGLMFYYDWTLTIAVLVVVVTYGIVAVLVGRRVAAHNRDILHLTGRLQGIVLQLLGAVSKVRVTGSEREAFARWASTYSRLQSTYFDQQSLNNALVVLKSSFTQLALFAVILVIAWQGGEIWAFYATPTDWSEISDTGLRRIMPTGRFVSFHVAYGQLLATVFGLVGLLIQITNIKPLYERVTPVLAEPLENPTGSGDPGDVQGKIACYQVSFRYEEDLPLVIEDVSFEAQVGEVIALVGPSGAGKSSLIRLLLGFDHPESGSILLDDQDIATLDKQAMRRSFGVVLQNSRVLSGSIFQNISAGRNLSQDEVWEAARMAGLDQDIEAMPMGLQTFVSEGATTFSGGQRQRLMIARAIARKPRVLIFDEATSALDNQTQKVVTDSLMRLGCTRVLIAHRLSTIVGADKICVLDKGRIVEMGTYEQLLARKGLFARMAERQLL